MNATVFLNYKLPKDTTVKAQEWEPKLIPHPDNSSPRSPSSTKLISRLTESGPSNLGAVFVSLGRTA